jgi:hypothetical protein
MNITKFGLIIIACFLVSIDFLLAQTQTVDTTNISARNIKIETTGNQVTINYDINNSRRQTLQVSVLMKKKDDNSFRYIPRYLSGDIGEGIFHGRGRKIIWDTQKERLPLFNMDDYFFEITVKIIPTKDYNKWLWIGAGAAVVVGGTVLYLILSDKDDPGMPQPPGRP